MDGAIYATDGTAAPGWAGISLGSQGDAFFAGDVEIDGALYVDGFIYGNASQLTGIPTTAGLSANVLPMHSGGAFVDAKIYGDVSGNLAIGTTTPTTALTVYSPAGTRDPLVSITGGAISSSIGVNIGNASGLMTLFAVGSDNDFVPGARRGDGGIRIGADDFHIGNTSGAILSVKTAGNVGIGTTVPTARLDVGGGSLSRANSQASLLVKGEVEVDNRIYVDQQLYVGTPTISWAGMDGTAGEAAFANDVEIDGALYVDRAIYGPNNFFVGPNGNVGIGLVNPSSALDVSGQIEILDRVWLGYDGNNTVLQSGGGKGIKFKTNSNTWGSAVDRVFIDYGGNVAIGGHLTPTALLDVGAGTRDRANLPGSLLVKNDVEIDRVLYVDQSVYVGTGLPSWAGMTGEAGEGFFAGDVEIDGALYVDGFIYGNGSKITGIPSTANLSANAMPRNLGGTFVDSSVYADVNGNIGIGPTTPGTRLDVTGAGRFSGSLYVNGGSYFGSTSTIVFDGTRDPTVTMQPSAAHRIALALKGVAGQSYNIFEVRDSNLAVLFGVGPTGNVGVGTSRLAAQKLEVDGSIYVPADTGNIGLGTWTPVVGLQVGAGTPGWAGMTAQSDAYVAGDTEVDGTLYVDTAIYGPGLFTIKPNGYVGIGKANPGFALDVSGSMTVSGGIYATNYYNGNTAYNFVGATALPSNQWNFNFSTGGLTAASGTGGTFRINAAYNQPGPSTASNIDLLVARTETAIGSGLQYLFMTQNGGDSKFSITNLGNIGIGTNQPRGLLEVDSTPYGTPFIVTTTNNVGIGTAEPVVGLQLGAGDPGWDAAMTDQADAYVAGDVEIDGALYVDGFIYGNGSKITGIASAADLSANSIPKNSGGSFVDSTIYVDANGNVGIAETAPVNRLNIKNGYVGLTNGYGVYFGSSATPYNEILPGMFTSGTTLAFSSYDKVVVNLDSNVNSSNQSFDIVQRNGNLAGAVSSANLVFRAMQEGNVGIISSGIPGAKLVVDGSVYIPGTGNVGVGTVTPAVGLQVGAGTPGWAGMTAQSDAYVAGDTEVDGTLYVDTAIYGPGNFYVLPSGNVGIGIVPSSSFALRVNGPASTGPLYASALYVSSSHVRDGYFLTGTNPASAGAVRLPNNSNVAWRNSGNSDNLTFGVNSQNEFVLTGGNLGIGIDGPTAKLAVDGGIYIPGAGNLGIGTLAPRERLEINNTVTYTSEVANTCSGGGNVTIDWHAGNRQKLTLDTAGDCAVTFTPPNGVTNILLKITWTDANATDITWSSSPKWPSGAAPTLSKANGKVDIVTCYYDGTDFFCAGSLDLR